MEELILRRRDEQEVKMMSPLTWAYIGDCVYELYVRQELINKTNLKPHKLHIEAINYVKASKQAKILKEIKDELTDNEKDIVRRGRNSENHYKEACQEPRETFYGGRRMGNFGRELG